MEFDFLLCNHRHLFSKEEAAFETLHLASNACVCNLSENSNSD